MTIISSLIRFGRRQLHTIVSTEYIKPSVSTPSHLITYNLSVYDQFNPSTFSPLVTFYSNTSNYHSSHDQILELKNSLSRILTNYYPFAGTHAQIAPTYCDCNDYGTEFIEASIDSTIADFLQNSQHEDLDHLFPHARTWNNTNRNGRHLQSDIVIPLAVQVNRFECGGIALAASLSHKIADAYSFIRFISDWAKTTTACLKKETNEVPIDQPHFISFQKTYINFSGYSLELSNDCVTKRFMFPNSKITELKLKVRTMTARSGQHITNPTRVEVLTWLLYKCAVGAATKNNLGSFKPTSIHLATNLRDKLIEPLPENSIGNFISGIEVQTKNDIELAPELIIGELRNKKKKIHGVKNIEAAFSPLLNISSDFDLDDRQKKFENAYVCTSLCRYPAYAIDFGWGKPLRVAAPGNVRKNSFILMDAPNDEGIEVLVCLGKQDITLSFWHLQISVNVESNHFAVCLCFCEYWTLIHVRKQWASILLINVTTVYYMADENKMYIINKCLKQFHK